MNLFSDPNHPTHPAHHLVLLAPDEGTLPSAFRKATVDARRYDALLGAMQKMRGSIYLNDGAIDRSKLGPDGRHVVESDRRSWHVLSVDPSGAVAGCSRYLSHHEPVSFEDLIVGKAPIAQHPLWGALFHSAIESEMSFARRQGLAFVEVGGWAVEDSLRFTTEALRIALATYALARWLGGCIGVTTATVRHCSSRILRKIGGSRLDGDSTAIPSYFDPQYQCEMEILRFDSRRPSPQFQSWIELIFKQLAEAPVIWRTREIGIPAVPVFEPAAVQYLAARG